MNVCLILCFFVFAGIEHHKDGNWQFGAGPRASWGHRNPFLDPWPAQMGVWHLASDDMPRHPSCPGQIRAEGQPARLQAGQVRKVGGPDMPQDQPPTGPGGAVEGRRAPSVGLLSDTQVVERLGRRKVPGQVCHQANLIIFLGFHPGGAPCYCHPGTGAALNCTCIHLTEHPTAPSPAQAPQAELAR